MQCRPRLEDDCHGIETWVRFEFNFEANEIIGNVIGILPGVKEGLAREMYIRTSALYGVVLQMAVR